MRTMAGTSSRTARRNLGWAFGKQGNEVVLANALQHEEVRRALARIGDEVRPVRRHRIGFARLERHVLLGALQENADRSLQHVKRVLHVAVIVPGHLLRFRELQLVDAEPRALGVERPAFDLVKMAGVLQRFHSTLASSPEYSARIAGTSKTCTPCGPRSTAATSAATISEIVTSPSRRADSRVGGSRAKSA